jgi:hypothetical protein
VARGFESKSVADQQESREDARTREAREAAPVAAVRKRLELALADVRGQLLRARSVAHRAMLNRALAALEADIARL